MPGGVARCFQPRDRGLGDGDLSENRTGARCAQPGAVAAAADERDSSFRPVSTPRSPFANAAARPAYAPQWVRSATASITRCVRASSLRLIANCSAAAQNPDRSAHGRLRIHRGLVQSSLPPFRPRLSFTDQLRKDSANTVNRKPIAVHQRGSSRTFTS